MLEKFEQNKSKTLFSIRSKGLRFAWIASIYMNKRQQFSFTINNLTSHFSVPTNVKWVGVVTTVSLKVGVGGKRWSAPGTAVKSKKGVYNKMCNLNVLYDGIKWMGLWYCQSCNYNKNSYTPGYYLRLKRKSTTLWFMHLAKDLISFSML